MWQCDMTSDKQHIPQMVLKCADIGHLAVDPKTHKRWAFQLEEEFFRQVRPMLNTHLPDMHNTHPVVLIMQCQHPSSCLLQFIC